jgi:hypothetical protein
MWGVEKRIQDLQPGLQGIADGPGMRDINEADR